MSNLIGYLVEQLRIDVGEIIEQLEKLEHRSPPEQHLLDNLRQAVADYDREKEQP